MNPADWSADSLSERFLGPHAFARTKCPRSSLQFLAPMRVQSRKSNLLRKTRLTAPILLAQGTNGVRG